MQVKDGFICFLIWKFIMIWQIQSSCYKMRENKIKYAQLRLPLTPTGTQTLTDWPIAQLTDRLPPLCLRILLVYLTLIILLTNLIITCKPLKIFQSMSFWNQLTLYPNVYFDISPTTNFTTNLYYDRLTWEHNQGLPTWLFQCELATKDSKVFT